MASSMPHVSSADQAGMSSSLFYGLPRTLRKRFLGYDSLLRHIDCNQSDISDDSSDDEVEVPTVDRNSDEESTSTESEDEITAPTTGLKATYTKKRYTWKKTSFQPPYLPSKPKCKWGLKLWARAGESGLCYDFDVYPASSKGFYGDEGGYELGLGARVVIQLCSSLPDRDNNLIIGDNFIQVLIW
ncbi:hypothetical protein MRX96_055079 [Rhipicephalus microplus]